MNWYIILTNMKEVDLMQGMVFRGEDKEEGLLYLSTVVGFAGKDRSMVYVSELSYVKTVEGEWSYLKETQYTLVADTFIRDSELVYNPYEQKSE